MEMVHFIPPAQRRLAIHAAQADSAPVLIYGASGTGKGAIARWIHSNGPRSAKPFLTAVRNRLLGEQIPEAQGGTLLVGDIGEWPLSEQRVLLNFIDTKSVPFTRRPDDENLRVLANVRIIATTDQALEGRAQAGLFNAELLEKLNVFRLEMPPLTKRTDEFEDIVIGIMKEIGREIHKEHLRGPSKETWECLRSYDWPGNIRELRNVLKLAVASAKGDYLETQDLPEFGHNRVDFHATREQFEKIYILELLRTFRWDVEKTCEMSRLDKAALLEKMKKYDIKRMAPPESPLPPEASV